MPAYRIRFLNPPQSEIFEISAETTPEEVVNDFFADHHREGYVVRGEARDSHETLYAALLEISAEALQPLQLVARYFYAGIGRKGGVRPQKNPRQCDTMEQLCDRLGVPYDFFDEAWVLEEENRAMLRDPAIPVTAVARRYGVSRTTIYKYVGVVTPASATR